MDRARAILDSALQTSSYTLAILGCSVLALALVLHDGAGWLRARDDGEALGRDVRDMLARCGDVGEVLRATAWRSTPAAGIIRAMLLVANKSPAEVQAARATAELALLARRRSRGDALHRTAAIAGLFGLAGNTAGLFVDLHAAVPAFVTGRNAFFAYHWSVALSPSALGLAVAILALCSHALVTHLADELCRSARAGGAVVAGALDETRPWLRLYGMRAPRDFIGYRD